MQNWYKNENNNFYIFFMFMRKSDRETERRRDRVTERRRDRAPETWRPGEPETQRPRDQETQRPRDLIKLFDITQIVEL